MKKYKIKLRLEISNKPYTHPWDQYQNMGNWCRTNLDDHTWDCWLEDRGDGNHYDAEFEFHRRGDAVLFELIYG